MSQKFWITLGLIVGSTAGSYVPTIFGGSLLGLASVFGTFIGGIIGVWIGYKLGQEYSS